MIFEGNTFGGTGIVTEDVLTFIGLVAEASADLEHEDRELSPQAQKAYSAFLNMILDENDD